MGEIGSKAFTYFMATTWMYFPFLTCEVKCGAAALDVADRQNAHSMTVAVKGVIEPLQSCETRERASPGNSCLFGLARSQVDENVWPLRVFHWAPHPTGQVVAVAPNSTQQNLTALPITGSGTEAGVASSHRIAMANNPTNRQLAAVTQLNELDRDAANIQDIFNRWSCTKHECSNKSKYCWVNDEGRHYRVTPEDARVWWGSIKNDPSKRLSKEVPPQSMIKTWDDTRKLAERRKKREQKDEAIPFGPALSAGYTGWGPSTPAYGGCGYGLPTAPPMAPPPLQSIRTSQLEAELNTRGSLQLRERSSTRQISRSATRDIGASPPLRDSSPVDGDIAEYIDWIKPKLHPSTEYDLDDAMNKLLDEQHTTRDVQGWKCDEFEYRWEKLQIKPGIGRSLARMVGQFGREREQSQARGHTRSGRLSTLPSRSSPHSYRHLTAISPTVRYPSATKGHVIESVEHDTATRQEQDQYWPRDADLNNLDYYDDSQETQW